MAFFPETMHVVELLVPAEEQQQHKAGWIQLFQQAVFDSIFTWSGASHPAQPGLHPPLM